MSEWARTLLVGAGGFVGATLRYTLGGLVYRVVSPEFPWATLLVNVSGCFVIGVLAVLTEDRGPIGPAGRLFLMVGVLGGYTTFSTWMVESILLAEEGGSAGIRAGAVNTIGLFAAGITVATIGFVLGQWM